MKKQMILSILFTSIFAAGCARDKGLDVFSPLEDSQKVVEASDEAPEIKVTPMVEVVFVVDDSWSMTEEIKILSRNIPQFVEAFSKYTNIDYQIGVVPVWDSIRYQDSALNPKAPVAQFSSKTLPNGEVVQQRNFWSKGELLPLKAKNEQGQIVELVNEPRFITARTPDLQTVLTNTLLLNPVEHIPGRDPKTNEYVAGAGQGPEFEELFSPVRAVFSDLMLNNPETGANRGFSRKCSHKVIVFVTDADDESQNLTPSQLDRFLRELTGDNSRSSFSTFAVMYPSGRARNSKCSYDPGIGSDATADKLAEFMALTQGTVMSICDNFGDKLAALGESVVNNTLKNIVVPLTRYPEYTQTVAAMTDSATEDENGTPWLQVFYGEEEIPMADGSDYGWSWDFDKNSIIIRGADKLEPVVGAEFKIKFTAINLRNLNIDGVKQSF
jgi:hypothetical protein